MQITKEKEKRTCAICGKEYIPRWEKQVTCGTECSKERHKIVMRMKSRKKADERPPEILKCDVCGKEFLKSYGRQKCCSADCQAIRKKRLCNEYWNEFVVYGIKKRKRKLTSSQLLQKDSEAANSLCISYGQLQAMRYMEKYGFRREIKV